MTAKVGKTVSVPGSCSGWRADWSPSTATSTRRLTFVGARPSSSNKAAKVTSNGYHVAAHTWTVTATKATTVRIYYRINASYYDKSTKKWRSAGNSSARDWIVVVFTS